MDLESDANALQCETPRSSDATASSSSAGGAHAHPDVPIPADDQREQFLRHWCCIMSELEHQLFDPSLGLTARQSSHRWRSVISKGPMS